MGYKPQISVIVPVYNIKEYLPRCVSSIINQTYEKLEIILDDESRVRVRFWALILIKL